MNHLSFYWLQPDKEKQIDALKSDFCKLVEQSILSNNIVLPPIPDVVIKIQQLSSNESATIKEVAETLLADPGLTANVIRVSNSAVFNRSNITCNSAVTAVSRLGIYRVRDLVTAQAIEELKNSTNLNAECNQLLKKSALSSRDFAAVMTLVCQSMIKHKELDDTFTLEPEKALLTGLLADIGIFCLISEYYEYQNAGNYLSFDIATQIFNSRCSYVSKIVLSLWGFDQDFIDVATNKTTNSNQSESVSYLDIARMANHLLMFRSDDSSIDEHDVEITALGAEALYELSNLSDADFRSRIKEVIKQSGL
ncbi:HDOD domain-containing protein [Aliivibrio kagoshimensis]|uniref:HDOD domain-containing protein n=1 Tax=Aliivibrio kagoshimensis TaxID=2910230 RepID=UPI003D12D464